MAGLSSLAIAGLASVAGGLSAQNQREQAAKGAAGKQKEAMEMIAGLDIPEMDKLRIQYELPQLLGQYTPEMLQTILQGPSAMEGIATDPRLATAQQKALSSLEERGQAGLTAEEDVQMRNIIRKAGAEAQAQDASIMSDLAQKGMSGSGQELAARMMAGQAAADRTSQEGLKLGAMALERMLSADVSAGDMAGNLRTQDFSEQSDIARAKDIIASGNIANQRTISSSNVDARNKAALRKLEEEQKYADTHVATRNLQKEQDAALLIDDYNRRKEKVGKLSGLKSDEGSALISAGESSAKGITGATKGITDLVGTMKIGTDTTSKESPTKFLDEAIAESNKEKAAKEKAALNSFNPNRS